VVSFSYLPQILVAGPGGASGPAGSGGPGGSGSGIGGTGGGGMPSGIGAALTERHTLVLLRLARRAAAKAIWRG
jgi:hypothetical protein